MSYLPEVYDLNDPDILTAEWLQSNKLDYDESGNLVDARTELQGNQKPNAKFGNGVSEVLRQLARAWQGLAMPDQWKVAEFFTPPLYTTAGLPAAAVAGEGSVVFDTTTNRLKSTDGAAWVEYATAGDITTGITIVEVNGDVDEDNVTTLNIEGDVFDLTTTGGGDVTIEGLTAGGVGFDRLANASARSLVGRAANSVGSVAAIAGAGSASAPQVASDDGSTVAFRTLSTLVYTSRVAYEVDFSTLANNTITDGAEVIDGLSWTGLNSASAGTFAIQNGTGLRISAATSVAALAFTSATQDVPMVYIPLGSLPNYDPQYDWIVEVYMSTLTLEASGEAALLGLWGPANTPGSSVARVQVGGIRQNVGSLSPRITNATTVTIGTEVITTHNVMALKIRCDRADLLTGVHSGSAWPTVYNSSLLGADQATHSMYNHSSVRLALAGAFASDASPTTTIVYRSLRLRRAS